MAQSGGELLKLITLSPNPGYLRRRDRLSARTKTPVIELPAEHTKPRGGGTELIG